MNAKFKIEHAISNEELQVYNVVLSKLNHGFDGLISLDEIKKELEEFSTNQLIDYLSTLRERTIKIMCEKQNMEISTTLFKFDYIFINKEVFMNFENVEIFDVEFKHYLGKFRSNQAYRSYENLDGRFNYYKDKIKEKGWNIVSDDFSTNILKEINKGEHLLDKKAIYDKTYYIQNKDKIKEYQKDYQKAYREKKKLRNYKQVVSKLKML